MLQMIIFNIVFKKYTVLCLFWINLHFSERVYINIWHFCPKWTQAQSKLPQSVFQIWFCKWFNWFIYKNDGIQAHWTASLIHLKKIMSIKRLNWKYVTANWAVSLFVCLFRMIRQPIQLICLKEPRRSSVSCVKFSKTVTKSSSFWIILHSLQLTIRFIFETFIQSEEKHKLSQWFKPVTPDTEFSSLDSFKISAQSSDSFGNSTAHST